MGTDESLVLSRDQFEEINGCDDHLIFETERDRFLASLSDEEVFKFYYKDFICSIMDRLYSKFEYIIVTPTDEIYGVRDGQQKPLYHSQGFYIKAKNFIRE